MRWRTWTTKLVVVMTGALVAGAVPLFTADFASAQECDSTSDFVTGGGWIKPDFGEAKANFGVAGGCKKGAFWGHLEYVDHGSGLLATTTAPTPFKVHGTEVTEYSSIDSTTGIDSTTRQISGIARTNDSENPVVTYCVQVTDNGEGKSGTGDMFVIQLSGDLGPFYVASGTLLGPFGGGNIQLHKGTPPPEGLNCLEFIPTE
jgi:hypothetical protein